MFNTAEQASDELGFEPTLDERNRQAFAKHLRQFVFGPARNAAARAFRERVVPDRAADAPPLDRKTARKALLAEPEYQFFSDLHRVSQELLWNSVADTLDREAPRLREAFRQLPPPEERLGSLQLTPALETPRYLRAMDTHCMPGGYHTDWTDDDLANGALYHRGSFLYSPAGGPRVDGAGRASLAWYRRFSPDAQPERILDIGCGAGAPMLPWAEAFPGAELHGVDVGAPLLRFAHLHAERLGVAMHFRQADAADTGYPDAHFDVVLAQIMFHETSARAVPAILREVHRVLRPGGVFVVVDLPDASRIPDVFSQVVLDGDAHYNNEHFWMRMHDLDWPRMFEKAGFERDQVQIGATPIQVYTPPDDDGAPGRWADGHFGFLAVHATR